MTGLVFFTVYGHAAPAGSKRVLPAGGRRGGRPIVVDDSRRSRPWKQEVAAEAAGAMEGGELMTGPLGLELAFYLRRPAGHFGARGVRPSAPAWPIVRPDLLKLARAIEDALSGIVYRDDAQIVHELIVKRYGDPERVDVTVKQLDGPHDPSSSANA